MKANAPTGVIGQVEVWESFSNLRTGGMSGGQSLATGVTQWGRGFEARFVSFDEIHPRAPRNSEKLGRGRA